MVANQFPDIAQRNWTMMHVELPLVLRLFGVARTARVLDLGSGRGFGLAALAAHGFHKLFGIDLDQSALTHADQSPRIRLCCADACALPIASESVDVVFDFGTSYHVHDAARALAEIQRVLRPGGTYIHETRVNQLMSHPVRSWGRMLPFSEVPRLLPARHALLWASRVKH
jgi:SAM-dependent methyltransferase